MTPRRVLATLVGLSLAAAALWWTVDGQDRRPSDPVAYGAPDLEPMTAQIAATEAYRLAPALLLTVYKAFGETDEETIYDTLATVAAGAALETLYLDRASALAGGGLDGSDQTVHEMRLRNLDTRRDGETLQMEATWDVVGIVGHDEHQHVRGNTYRAGLTVAPSQGAWKITGFDLRAVDRSGAGQAIQAQTQWSN